MRRNVRPRQWVFVILLLAVAICVGQWWRVRVDDRRLTDDIYSLFDEDVKPAVVLDPGHGGVDPGANGHGLVEKDVVLDIALRTADALMASGVPATVTREVDMELSPKKNGRTFYGDRHVRDLQNRLDYARALDAWALVSIHANSSEVNYAKGQVVIYQSGVNTSERMAEVLCQELSNFGRCQTRVEKAYLLQDPMMPAVLVEVGYLTNPEEARQLGTVEYRQQLAEAIAQALAFAWEAR